MDFALFFVLVAVAPAYLTSFACRLVQSRKRKAGWHLGVLSAMAAGLLMVLCIYIAEVFSPSTWDDNEIFIPMVFVVASVISLVPALFMVWYYRKRFRDIDHVAEPKPPATAGSGHEI
jgi:uncharacterized membrane protein YhaH (DUF805 family)